MRKLIPFYFLVIVSVNNSCISRLDSDDLNWFVYESGDTLIFESSYGILDTTYILSKSKKLVNYNPINVHGFDNWPEIAQIWYYNPNVEYIHDGKELLYLEKSQRTENASGFICYYNDYFFFESDNFIEIDTLIQIDDSSYNDILEITSSYKIGLDCSSIRTIWWSKLKGIVSYETCSGIKWKLIKTAHNKG